MNSGSDDSQCRVSQKGKEGANERSSECRQMWSIRCNLNREDYTRIEGMYRVDAQY